MIMLSGRVLPLSVFEYLVVGLNRKERKWMGYGPRDAGTGHPACTGHEKNWASLSAGNRKLWGGEGCTEKPWL